MLAQEHLPHSADADSFEVLVPSDGEAAPFALQELLGLEVSQDSTPDHFVCEWACLGDTFETTSGEKPREDFLLNHSALANEFEEFLNRDGTGHWANHPVENGVGYSPTAQISDSGGGAKI